MIAEMIHGFFMVHWVGNPSCAHCGLKSRQIVFVFGGRSACTLFHQVVDNGLSRVAGGLSFKVSTMVTKQFKKKKKHVSWKGPNIFGPLIQIPKLRMPRTNYIQLPITTMKVHLTGWCPPVVFGVNPISL